MAEESGIDWETYEKSKPDYNKSCVSTWEGWFSKFKKRIKENVQLANNYSEDLAKRKKDKRLSRACLFIPVLNPAIYARAGYMRNMLFSVDDPITVIPKYDTPPENADNVKAMIHDYLEKDDFENLWLEVKLAQEQFPISFLQVSETEDEETVLRLRKETSSLEGTPNYQAEMGIFKNWDTEKGQWRPTLTLRTQQSVFYDPEPSQWEDKQFVGTITPLTLGECVARKESHDYNFSVDELKEKGEKMGEDDFTDELRSGIDRETKTTVTKMTKYKVVENFHRIEDDEGKTYIKITTTCGDVEMRESRDWPYEKLNITDMFIPIIGYPILNQVEGNTTADLGKYLQHAINDFFNITIDFAKYSLFPPRVRDSRCEILNRNVVGPGSELELGMQGVPEGMSVRDMMFPLFNVTAADKDFFNLIGVLREMSEIVMSAPQDILTGSATDPDEKATKTKARVAGASSKLSGLTLLSDVTILKKIAYAEWVMTLERQPHDEMISGQRRGIPFDLELIGIMGRFDFDVPHLSGMAQREIKLERLRELRVSVSQMPFAQDPEMMPVLYNMLREEAELSLVNDFDELFPPDVIERIKGAMKARAMMEQMQGGQGGS